MESIDDFVRRTNRPLVPFLEDWYPWTYAHHYLRMERELLPVQVLREKAISLDDAIQLIRQWCDLTGEDVEDAARALADAYLLRWGIRRRGAPAEPRRTAGRDGRRSARTRRTARVRLLPPAPVPLLMWTVPAALPDLAPAPLADAALAPPSAIGRASVGAVAIRETAPADDELTSAKTKANLLEEARRLGIIGRSTMSKEQLWEAVRRHYKDLPA